MNRIHPTAIIGPNVELGEGNVVGPFVLLSGTLVVGDDNWFGAGVVVGVPPEVRGQPHPADPDLQTGPGVTLGSRNVFREHVQIHGGWKRQTEVGDDAFVMNQVYLAHDTRVGNEVTLASGARLAGHVVVLDGTNLGMGALVHQRRVVGSGAMIGMGAVVTRDVPPFAKAFGVPASIRGVNTHRLERVGLGAYSTVLAEALRTTTQVPARSGEAALDNAVTEWIAARA